MTPKALGDVMVVTWKTMQEERREIRTSTVANSELSSPELRWLQKPSMRRECSIPEKNWTEFTWLFHFLSVVHEGSSQRAPHWPPVQVTSVNILTWSRSAQKSRKVCVWAVLTLVCYPTVLSISHLVYKKPSFSKERVCLFLLEESCCPCASCLYWADKSLQPWLLAQMNVLVLPMLTSPPLNPAPVFPI